MKPLYADMTLSKVQEDRVHEWLRSTGFTHPDVTHQDFEVVNPARYVGFLFTHESVETFVVGLQCTAPGMEHVRTTIRMSHGQIMGETDAPTFEPHAPVTAAQSMRMLRWRHRPEALDGHGGPPGINLDLTMIEDYLEEIIAFTNEHGSGSSAPGWYELSVQWGVLLSGRWPRLEFYRDRGDLDPQQMQRWDALTRRISQHTKAIEALHLPVPHLADHQGAVQQPGSSRRRTGRRKSRDAGAGRA